MKIILKFPLGLGNNPFNWLVGYEIISFKIQPVQENEGEENIFRPTIWVMFDSKAKTKADTNIFVVYTGVNIDGMDHYRIIGTAISPNGLVYHAIEIFTK